MEEGIESEEASPEILGRNKTGVIIGALGVAKLGRLILEPWRFEMKEIETVMAAVTVEAEEKGGEEAMKEEAMTVKDREETVE